MRCKSLPKSEASYRTVNEKTFIFFSLVLCSICWSSRISIVTHVQTMHIIVLFKLCHLFILWGFTKRDWIVRAQHWHINTQDLCRAHFMCVCMCVCLWRWRRMQCLCIFQQRRSSDLVVFHSVSLTSYEFHSLKWIFARNQLDCHLKMNTLSLTVRIKFTWTANRSANHLKESRERERERQKMCYVNAM